MTRARTVATAMLLAACAMLLVVEACGESLPEAGEPSNEAGAAIDVAPGGDDAGEGCNPTADFTAPIAIAGITVDVVSFRLTADEKVAFYVTPDGDVFRAPMISAQEVGTPAPIVIDFGDAEVIGTGKPTNVSISGDGGLMFLEGSFKLWSARSDGDGGWPAKEIAPLTGHPFLDEPGNQVFATRFEAGTTGRGEIVVAQRTGDDSVDAFASVGVRVPATAPLPAPDGGGLFFAAEVPARELDMFHTALPAVADADVPVANVSGSRKDYPTWMSSDGCRLYLISGRESVWGRPYLSRRGR